MRHAHLQFHPSPGSFCAQCLHPDGGDDCWQWEMRVDCIPDSGRHLMHSTRFCRHCFVLTVLRLAAIRQHAGFSYSVGFDEKCPTWLDVREILLQDV